MKKILLEYQKVSIQIKNLEIDKILTRDLSFQIYSREIFGLVGESGSGKSISAYSILGLYPQPGGFLKEGDIHFDGRKISNLSEIEYQKIRGIDIAMIYQEPSAALNPLMKIKRQLQEVVHNHPHRQSIDIYDTLKKVGFNKIERVLNAYPHELSGGMQQRVMIAMALLLKPKLLIADEPTTALDVTIQKQVMDLLLQLQEETGMAILFISHNLALMAQYADRMAIMSEGQIVEQTELSKGLPHLTHPYSISLLEALPKGHF